MAWEVEGFIDRLTKRDDANSERLVLEAISHLRAFSRDCDALRAENSELRAEVERLRRDVIENLRQARFYLERLAPSAVSDDRERGEDQHDE